MERETPTLNYAAQPEGDRTTNAVLATLLGIIAACVLILTIALLASSRS
jgi:hypothetical protein